MGVVEPQMNAASKAQPVPRKGRSLQIAAGYLFAALCLAWVFHDVHPLHVLAQVTVAHSLYLLPAVFFDIATYVLQGWRWSLLLRPNGRLSTMRTTQAIYAGLFTNEILPLRIGEGVRAYLASRWLNTPLRKVLPSILVERLLDAACLLLGLGYTAIVAPLPRELAIGGEILGIVVLTGTVLFVVVVLRSREPTDPTESRSTSALTRNIQHIASGLHQIGMSRWLWTAFPISAVLLICQALATWFMMLAFGLDLPLHAGFVVLIIVRLGTAIPNAPANVGSFQFFTVVALAIYGVNKTTATAFSIVDFLALTLPLWILGLVAMLRSGMSLATLRARASETESTSYVCKE